MTALAAAGGTAVVQAVGTDAWNGLRGQVARWFGRGDTERERREVERLDSSAAELAAADDSTVELVRERHETVWRTRIETLLGNLGDEQRAHAADQLRELLEQAGAGPASDGALVSDNTFSGPTAFQAGNNNRQDVRFGPEA
ncbi:hypothetical protein OG912_38885 (plasmid) [Streptomyces sp. NBC_00464]|uniref:hypothetical protein n=1 Tax=Streptomyces sp. NBC_00464 TaxID=2975751 RepID=UPI002E182D49